MLGLDKRKRRVRQLLRLRITLTNKALFCGSREVATRCRLVSAGLPRKRWCSFIAAETDSWNTLARIGLVAKRKICALLINLMTKSASAELVSITVVIDG